MARRPEDLTAGDVASQAIVIYVGGGYPGESEQERAKAVLNAFGRARGERLVSQVESIMAEMDGLTPDWDVLTPLTAGQRASQTMRELHPWLDDGAVQALELTYAWWVR